MAQSFVAQGTFWARGPVHERMKSSGTALLAFPSIWEIAFRNLQGRGWPDLLGSPASSELLSNRASHPGSASGRGASG